MPEPTPFQQEATRLANRPLSAPRAAPPSVRARAAWLAPHLPSCAIRPQVRDRVSQVQKQLKRHEHALRDKIAKDAADLEQSLCELEH